jgi:glutaredoxin
MDYLKPESNRITIYSKSGCINCVRLKHLLIENNLTFVEINCDEYLLENREEFLSQMKKLIGHEYKMFPMIFVDDKFIGGFIEMKNYIEKSLDFNSLF